MIQIFGTSKFYQMLRVPTFLIAGMAEVVMAVEVTLAITDQPHG